MPLDFLRLVVTRHPGRVVLFWFAVAVVALAVSPSLTRLAAEGQADLLPADTESIRVAELVRQTWPDQASQAIAVVAMERPAGLTTEDREFARKMAAGFEDPRRPADILRVLGPASAPEIAQRLVSRDRTVQLLVIPFKTAFVSPSLQAAVVWLQERAKPKRLGPPPEGLLVEWTGDAVIGRDYMQKIRQSLDRAAYATVFLLLGVLLLVYRSFLLATIPLVTIGIGLVLSRSVLAWLALAGWEVSPLVELFLVVLLFGCGTDFCLFLSWRFGEHWNAANPAGAMRATLKRSFEPVLTSAGTVIVGLSLMGTTRFKLFSSTGPSVALGLGITVLVGLTFTPALLILLARLRPKSFAGLTAPSTGFWDDVGHRVLARPIRTWLAAILVLVPVAVIGVRTEFLQDLFSELPKDTPAVKALAMLSEPNKFGPGRVAPLAIVLRTDRDLRDSEGLALIDDVSRYLTQKKIAEVRSATQPLGSPAPLEKARIESRLTEVNDGFRRMAEGARKLRDGLAEGKVKLQLALKLEKITGLPLTGGPITDKEARDSVASGLRQASAALFGAKKPESHEDKKTTAANKVDDPREQMLRELDAASKGASQIADGAERANQELTKILRDPVGHETLNRLLITPGDIREHPELQKSFDAYLSPDGRLARFDVEQDHRMFSNEAMEQVLTLRKRLRDYLTERTPFPVSLGISGANAESADVWTLTRSDQRQTWIVVPIGVFLVLLVTLRDGWACLNLVATMLLTYAFALGTTHLVFVSILGHDGLDWKVPYFLFVLLVAVGVDYNIFLMTRLKEETRVLGLKAGINRAIAQTGGLISSAAAITACSFAAMLFSPLGSLKQLGFALVVGIVVDAILVRPLLVPIGHWLIHRRNERRRETQPKVLTIPQPARVAD